MWDWISINPGIFTAICSAITAIVVAIITSNTTLRSERKKGLNKVIEKFEKEKIDLSNEISSLKSSLDELTEENELLTDISKISELVQRNPDLTIVTRKDEDNKIPYCSLCWDIDRKLVQLHKRETGQLNCLNINCGNKNANNKPSRRSLAD